MVAGEWRWYGDMRIRYATFAASPATSCYHVRCRHAAPFFFLLTRHAAVAFIIDMPRYERHERRVTVYTRSRYAAMCALLRDI